MNDQTEQPRVPGPDDLVPGWAVPVPPTAPRRPWLFVLVATIFTSGLLIVALVAIVWTRIEPPVSATNDFLDALTHEEYPEAYEMLCAGDQAAQSAEEWASELEAKMDARRGIESYSIRWSELGRSRVEVSYDLWYGDGTRGDYTDVVVKDDGRWHVCLDGA